MKYDLVLTGKFKKGLKLAKKRGLDIKLLEDIGVNLHNLGLGNNFLDATPKAWATKETIDKLDFIKIKTFVL